MDLVENSTINLNVKRHPWELARYIIIKEKVAGMLAKVPSGVQPVLVDIGCGDAFVVQQLFEEFRANWSESGDSVFAIDINFTPENIVTLQQVNNDVRYLQHINELSVQSDKAYIVLLNDVIEHIEDHQGFIEVLNAAFAQAVQFQLFITVPAYEHLFSNHDVHLGHFRRYKVGELHEYAKSLNMKIQESGYFFLSLFLARSIVKIFEPEVDRNQEGIGVSDWKGGSIATLLFKTVLLIDYRFGTLLRLVGIRIPGLSTYAVMWR